MKRLLYISVAVGLLTLPIQSWHVSHWLTIIGAVLLAARPAKSWTFQHWLTVLGALTLAGVSTWLKYGGPDFRLGDTPVLALVLLVLRALYQPPPGGQS